MPLGAGSGSGAHAPASASSATVRFMGLLLCPQMARLPRDRVVLVTGASSGIGRATALAFARDGARVTVAARNEERLRDLAREIGDAALAVRADVTNHADVRRLVAATREKFGALHVLVNNAGVGVYAKVEATTDEAFDLVMKTNLYGAFYMMREVLPVLRAQKLGQIINITSTLGRVAMPLMSAYSASKFALTAMSDALRVEVRRDGIDVIVVGPGVTQTEFNRNAKVEGLRANPADSAPRKVGADSVARAIVRASKKRKRQVYLNLDSKFLIWMQGFSPRLVDWGFARWMEQVT
jgi:NAD(P)-dependent dehydrogenase (short-subunit alcohol dehydrogenase family)